jgi:large subunit ribosomal protein L24
LTGPSDQAPDPERGLVRIPWPAQALATTPEGESDISHTLFRKLIVLATSLDTSDPSSSTLKLPSTSALINSTLMGELLPTSSLEPIPNSAAAREWLDAQASTPGIPETDSTMPLFLSEELSPRFSRAKKTAGFNARRETTAREREEAGRSAVQAWEAGGRDKSLSEVLGGEGAEKLEGVKLRGRTRAEVREAAQVVFDQQQASVKRGVRDARKMEMRWSKEEGDFVDGARGENVIRKKERKVLKDKKVEKRMGGLRLEQGRNAVVPANVRA